MAQASQPNDQDQRPEDAGGGTGDSPTTYEPTMEQVNNGRVQGLGVGQKDIDYQRDPTRADSTEKFGDKQ